MTPPTYTYYRDILRGRPMPCAFIDADILDANIAAIAERPGTKSIRIASKSVRCRWVMERAFAANPVFQGVMGFSPHEAVFLASHGYDDILLGYPFFNAEDIRAVCPVLREGKRVTFMVDLPEHVAQLDRVGEAEGVTIPACVDVDMSSDYPGLHFGVRRSSITSAATVQPLLDAFDRAKHVRLHALMGYEAQVAGLPDRAPWNGMLNPLLRFLKKRSIREVARRRAEVVNAIRERGFELDLVNGGGTGSVEFTREEECVTEITVGSGFFAPGLFDHFDNFKHGPAAAFAIELVRRPGPHTYTCAGGGYVASGPAGKDKVPHPYLPEGAKLTNIEMAGEVQTPIEYAGPHVLDLGDPILLRHAKAGELCERFTSMLVIRNGAVVDEVPTYRGEGQCYL